jgi:LmeA-like phospholipid-binding
MEGGTVADYSAYTPPSGDRRRHRLRTTLIVVVAVLGLLVAADFIAKAVAENVLASQIKSHGFPKKPNVSIQGFPFLTQVIARDIDTIDISANNVTTGPVTITSITAVLHGVHIDSSFHGATVDRLNGTVFISFPDIAHALAAEGGLGPALGGAGLTITSAGRHDIQASLGILGFGVSATWRISRHGHDIEARLVTNNGLPSSVVKMARDIKVPLPPLPLQLTIRKVTVTPHGITGHLYGRNLSFNG